MMSGQEAVFTTRLYKLLTVGAIDGPLIDPPAVRAEPSGATRNLIAGCSWNRAFSSITWAS